MTINLMMETTWGEFKVSKMLRNWQLNYLQQGNIMLTVIPVFDFRICTTLIEVMKL